MTEDSRDLVLKLNLYVLQVISQLAKNDIADAMLCFGISREMAESFALMDPVTLYEIAKSPVFLFTIEEAGIKSAMCDQKEGQGYRSMHEVIATLSALLKKRKGG